MKNILVALDGSAPASRALAMASDLATRYGAVLHLVHVSPRPTVVSEGLKEFARAEGVDLPVAVEMSAEGQSIVAGGQAAALAQGGSQSEDSGPDRRSRRTAPRVRAGARSRPRCRGAAGRRSDSRPADGQRLVEGQQPGRMPGPDRQVEARCRRTGFHQAPDPLRGGIGNWDEAATRGAAVGHRVVLEANGEAVGLAPARRCGSGAAPDPGGARRGQRLVEPRHCHDDLRSAMITGCAIAKFTAATLGAMLPGAIRVSTAPPLQAQR